jgi:catechol 2,3-dioxygenase-like lactoylglutathione lyase family enzyme
MGKLTFSVRQIVTVLAIMASPIAVFAGAHTSAPPPVMLADVDPYVHRSNFIVADLERAFRVYRDIIGFKVDAVAPASTFMDDVLNIPAEADTRIAFLSSGEGEFGNIAMTEIKGVELPRDNGIHSSVLIVEVQRDMETLFAQLKAEGCEVEKIYELTRPSRREIAFTDLDGHRVILMKLHAPERSADGRGVVTP